MYRDNFAFGAGVIKEVELARPLLGRNRRQCDCRSVGKRDGGGCARRFRRQFRRHRVRRSRMQHNQPRRARLHILFLARIAEADPRRGTQQPLRYRFRQFPIELRRRVRHAGLALHFDG